MYDEIRSTYEGPLSLSKDLMVWNVTDQGIRVRDVVAQEAVWPAKPPTKPIPPTGKREVLPSWLIDGIQPMEDIIKAYYERQGVAEFYEKQILK
jgi:ribonuclease Z